MTVDRIGNNIDERAAVDDLSFVRHSLTQIKAIRARARSNALVDFSEIDEHAQEIEEWLSGVEEEINDALARYYREAS